MTIRKILRNMYRKSVPHRQRRKSFRADDGRIIPGTYRQWLKDRGPAKYLAGIEAKKTAAAAAGTGAEKK